MEVWLGGRNFRSMSLFVASINSGSNGNCYYIGNHSDAILVDAGISCKETEVRFRRLGLDIRKVRAVFISHEHSDHIHGLSVLAQKYQLPVYITSATLRESRLLLPPALVHSFSPHTPVCIGQLAITAFPKQHDAADPHSFVVSALGVKVGVFTDIGVVCEQVAKHFKECNAVFLEANYDEEMLARGKYPYMLKKRISGGWGHISNRQAIALLDEHRGPFLSHVFLSHLSRDNNDPVLVQAQFQAVAGNTEIVVASRFQESALYQIKESVVSTQERIQTMVAAYLTDKNAKQKARKEKSEFQLSLFS